MLLCRARLHLAYFFMQDLAADDATSTTEQRRWIRKHLVFASWLEERKVAQEKLAAGVAPVSQNA